MTLRSLSELGDDVVCGKETGSPPSLPRRLMSGFVIIWACSRRGRSAITSTPFSEASKASKTSPLARSPIAWTFYMTSPIQNKSSITRRLVAHHLPSILQELRDDIEQNLRIQTHEPCCRRIIVIRFVELFLFRSLLEGTKGFERTAAPPVRRAPSAKILTLLAVSLSSPLPTMISVVLPQYGWCSLKCLMP